MHLTAGGRPGGGGPRPASRPRPRRRLSSRAVRAASEPRLPRASAPPQSAVRDTCASDAPAASARVSARVCAVFPAPVQCAMTASWWCSARTMTRRFEFCARAAGAGRVQRPAPGDAAVPGAAGRDCLVSCFRGFVCGGGSVEGFVGLLWLLS